MIRVRLAMEWDRADLLGLFRSHAEEFAAHLGFDEDRANAALDQSLSTGSPVCFVAESDGEVIGYVTGRIVDYPYAAGHFVTHELLYVRPDKRGTRAAAKLIREFIQWGEIVGAREVFCGTSTDYKAERVARLFEHFGLRRVGASLKKVYP